MKTKKDCLNQFAFYYINELNGEMVEWTEEDIREELTGDIFVGLASAITGISEDEFIEYLIANKRYYE